MPNGTYGVVRGVEVNLSSYSIRILTMLFFLSGSSDYSPSVLEITDVLASVSSGTGPNLFLVSSPFLMVRMK